MSDLDMYQYAPLTSADAIRLLLLRPGDLGSQIHCSLIHTRLSGCHDDIYQHYTALSYVWGDAGQQRIVFVDNKPFHVTVNLATALHDLRHPQNVLRLWADAICLYANRYQMITEFHSQCTPTVNAQSIFAAPHYLNN
jgi:hypothetical protein